MRLLTVACTAATVVSAVPTADQFANQVHLSYGDKSDEMVVTWSTPSDATSKARFSDGQHHLMVDGAKSVFVDNGTLHHTQVHIL